MRIQAMRAARAKAEEQQLYAMDAAAKAREVAAVEVGVLLQAEGAIVDDDDADAAEAAMSALALAAPSPEKEDANEEEKVHEEEEVEEEDEPLPLAPNEVFLDISFSGEAEDEAEKEATQAEKGVVCEVSAMETGLDVKASADAAGDESAVANADAAAADNDGFVYIEDSGIPIPEFDPYSASLDYAAKLQMHQMRVARVVAEEHDLYEKDLERALAEASAGPCPWQHLERAGRRAMQAMRAARIQEVEQDLYAKDGEAALASYAAAEPNPWQHSERAGRRKMQGMRAARMQAEEAELDQAATNKALDDAITGPSYVGIH